MASSSLGPVDRQGAQPQESWGKQLYTALLLAGGAIGLGGLLSKMWSGGGESGEIKGHEIKNTTAGGLQTFSVPESTMLFDKMGISYKEPADLKCVSGLALGAVGTAVTGNPAALALGSALCFPEVSAQTASPKGYFFPTQTGVPSGNLDLCVSGIEGFAITDFEQANSTVCIPQVQLYSLNGSNLSFMQQASSNISSQLPYNYNYNRVRGLSQYTSGCKDGLYHSFITLQYDSVELFTYASLIENQTLWISPGICSFIDRLYTLPPFPDPWRPSLLLGNQSVFPSFNNSGSFLTFSTSSGGCPGTSSDQFPYGLPTASGPAHQDILAFDDGTFRLFTNQSGTGQMELEFRQEANLSITFLGSRLVYDQVIPDLTTPTTQVSKSSANFSTFISRGSDQMSPTLYTYDIVNHQIIASRALSQEPIPISKMRIAQCGPQYPHLYFYAKESINGSVAIDYSYVDAGNNSSAVTVARYSGYLGNTSTPPKPVTGCFDDATGIVGFWDENLDKTYFLTSPPQPDPPTPAPSTPVAVSSVPTLTPSGPSPTFTIISGAFTITVNLPVGLTSSFVPVTGQMIAVGPNVTKVILVDSGGYSLVFTANMSLVQEGQPFDPSVITQLSIAKVNSSGGDPTFLGCNDQYQCSISTPLAQSELQQETNLGDYAQNNLPIILGAVFGTVALSVVGAVLCWKFDGVQRLREVRAQKNEANQKRHDARKLRPQKSEIRQ